MDMYPYLVAVLVFPAVVLLWYGVERLARAQAEKLTWDCPEEADRNRGCSHCTSADVCEVHDDASPSD